MRIQERVFEHKPCVLPVKLVLKMIFKLRRHTSIWSSRSRVTSILSRRGYLEWPLDLGSKVEMAHHSAAICSFSLRTALKITIFRPPYENLILMKSAPLSIRFIVFDAYVATCSEKYRKRMVFERFILRHVGTSSPHLDWNRRDLGVKAAQYSKCVPLCSRLLVFLKSMSGRAWKPC